MRIQYLDKIYSRLFGQVPFRRLLSTVFGFIIIVTVAFTSYLLITGGNKVVESLVAQLSTNTAFAINKKIEQFLEIPDVINQTTSRAIRSGRVDVTDINSLTQFLWDSPYRAANFYVSSIYYADLDGNFTSTEVSGLPGSVNKWRFKITAPFTQGIYSSFATNLNGTLGPIVEQQGKFDPRERLWFKEAIASPDKAIWSNIYSDFDTGQATLTRAITVRDNNDRLIGVAAVDIFLEHIHEFLRTLPLSGRSEVFITGADDILIGAFAPAIDTRKADHNIPASRSPYNFVRAGAIYRRQHSAANRQFDTPFNQNMSLAGEAGHLYLASIGQEQGQKNELGWTLGVFIPKSNFLGTANQQIKKTLPLAVLTLLLAIATIIGFLALVVRPLRQLKHDAGLIAAGQFDVHIDTSNSNEVGQLAGSIDNMRNALVTSLRDLRELNSDLALEKSRIETTLNSIEDGVMTLDLEGRILFMNPPACKQTGWRWPQVEGHYLSLLAHDNCDPSASKAVAAAELNANTNDVKNAGTEFDVDIALCRTALLNTLAEAARQPADSLITLNPPTAKNPIFCEYSPIIDGSECLTGVVLVFNVMTDLLQLKTEHRAVQAAGSRLSYIVEEAANEIYIVEPSTFRVSRMNRAARQNLGYSEEQASQLMPWDIVQDLASDTMEQMYAPLFDGSTTVQFLETVHQRKDGSTYPTETRAHFLRHEEPPYIAAIVIDTTERRRQLENLLLRDKAIAEVDVGILICDARQDDIPIIYVNRAIKQMTGYASHELIGKNPRILQGTEQDQLPMDELRRALRNRQSAQVTMQNYRKNDTAYTVEMTISPVCDETGDISHYIGIQKDVTARIESEVLIRQAHRIDAVGRLSGGIAHDFNNLLTIISGRLDLLDGAAHDDSTQHHIKEAMQAADMGARLTHRLLAFARQGSLEPVVVNLNEQINNSLELLRTTIGEDITLQSTLEANLWPTLVDPSEIENSVVNLAINARDALPDGGMIHIKTSNIVLTAEALRDQPRLPPGDYVRLSVLDNGVGMSPDVQVRIFEPFYTTKLPGKGTGLGLASIFGFVKQSGGGIEAVSAVGCGTSIHLYLPRYAGQSSAVSPSRFSSSVAGLTSAVTHTAEKCVLVVEDNSQVRELTVSQLQASGFRVLQADSGPAALEILRSTEIVDLVFSDLVMTGGMSGQDVAQWVQSHKPHCKILLTSGFSEQHVEAVDGYAQHWKVLEKPYRLAKLKKLITDMLV